MSETVKPKHTYCFYMTNGEHLMIDADEMNVDIENEIISVFKEPYDVPFMQVFTNNLIAWEAVR